MFVSSREFLKLARLPIPPSSRGLTRPLYHDCPTPTPHLAGQYPSPPVGSRVPAATVVPASSRRRGAFSGAFAVRFACRVCLAGDALEQLHGRMKVAPGNDGVAVEYRPRLVAGELHGDALRDAALNHVPDGGAAEVMGHSSGNARRAARRAEGAAPCPRSPAPLESSCAPVPPDAPPAHVATSYCTLTPLRQLATPMRGTDTPPSLHPQTSHCVGFVTGDISVRCAAALNGTNPPPHEITASCELVQGTWTH